MKRCSDNKYRSTQEIANTVAASLLTFNEEWWPYPSCGAEIHYGRLLDHGNGRIITFTNIGDQIKIAGLYPDKVQRAPKVIVPLLQHPDEIAEILVNKFLPRYRKLYLESKERFLARSHAEDCRRKLMDWLKTASGKNDCTVAPHSDSCSVMLECSDYSKLGESLRVLSSEKRAILLTDQQIDFLKNLMRNYLRYSGSVGREEDQLEIEGILCEFTDNTEFLYKGEELVARYFAAIGQPFAEQSAV